MDNQQHQHHETTSPYPGTSSSRSLSMRTYPAPPPLHPNLFHPSHDPHHHPHPHPQDYFNFHPLSVPPLQHHYQHNQINPLLPILLPPYQPFPFYQPQPQFFTPEHHYLLLSLNRETTKALSLNQKIAAVESSLSSLERARSSIPPSPSTSTSPTPKPNRRKLKKQLSWLQCRVRESTRQEMNLRRRLGEIMQQEEERRCVGVSTWMWVFGGRQRGVDEGGCGGGEGVDARLGEGDEKEKEEGRMGRGFSNDFWNVEAPVFEPVDFLAPCARGGEGRGLVRGERGCEGSAGERLSWRWDECELSPLAEERVEGVGEWGGSGDGDGGEDQETEAGKPSGNSSANSSTETQVAITTPISQQSSKMIPVGGARSCGDVRLCFLDTKWEGGDGEGMRMEGCRAEVGLKGLRLMGRKGRSLPVVGEWVGFRERREVDQIW